MAIRTPCGGGGAAAPALCTATAEIWGNTAAYTIGTMVRDRTLPTDPWVLYLSTADHAAGQTAPSAGGAGWLPLSASPTTIPAWQNGIDYVTGAPVRIDTATATRVFIATQPVVGSTNSPDTAGGVGDGWVEVQVPVPPPAPPFSATATYRNGDLARTTDNRVWVATQAIAPSATTPDAAAGWTEVGALPDVIISTTPGDTPTGFLPALTPEMGDVFVNRADGLSWIYGRVVGGALGWEPIASAAGPSQHTYVGAGAFNAAAVAAPQWGMPVGTQPDPGTIEPNTGDIYFDTTAGTVTVLT